MIEFYDKDIHPLPVNGYQSKAVFALDDFGSPLAVYFDYKLAKWYSIDGYLMESVDFKWFYVENLLKSCK